MTPPIELNETEQKQAKEWRKNKIQEDPNNQFIVLLKNKVPKLEDVHNVYKKWLHVEDTKRIDAVLAVAITRLVEGTKLWLIIVGPSGDWKSVQINALNDNETTKLMRNFTSKTLVNGNPKTPDLAPQLKDKTLLIQDMAQILKLHPNEKAEVWAQLRDLYDGYAGKQSGMGKDVDYKDLNITLIAASTPAIDSQILIHQDLGTRELLYRVSENDKNELMKKVIFNEKEEELMKKELNEITTNFIKNTKYNGKEELTKEIQSKIKNLAQYLTKMRAPAGVDLYTGELINSVTPEEPTRVLKQLLRFYKALKSLDVNYSDELASQVIKHVVDSSAFQQRVKVLQTLIQLDDSASLTRIANILKMGKKTVFKELNVLWNLGFVEREDINDQYYRIKEYRFNLNKEDQIVKEIIGELAPHLIVKEEKVEAVT